MRLIKRVVCEFTSQRVFKSSQDFYKILEISTTASQPQIKKAYLKLAKKHHPDIDPKGHSKFTEIQEAYQILGNKESKREYDAFYNANINPKKQSNFYGDNIRKGQFYSQKSAYTHYYAKNEEQKQNNKYKQKQDKEEDQEDARYWETDFIKNSYFETLLKNREKWKQQFYQEFPKYKEKWANEKKKQDKKENKFEDQQYEKIQYSFSRKNPFNHHINSPINSYKEREHILDIGLKKILGKFKSILKDK